VKHNFLKVNTNDKDYEGAEYDYNPLGGVLAFATGVDRLFYEWLWANPGSTDSHPYRHRDAIAAHRDAGSPYKYT
jgi:hypothetical protein